MRYIVVKCSRNLRGLGGWLGVAILFGFLVSYYTPISAKASNNIFYVGLGAPAILWWFWRPNAAFMLVRVAPEFIAAYAALAAWLVFADVDFFKSTLYLVALFICCVMLEREGPGVVRAYTGFALVSIVLLAVAVFKWIESAWSLTSLQRVTLWGEGANPVYAALLITSSLVFLWLFYLERHLASRPRGVYLLGLSGLVALASVCALVFQARSALVGFAAFLIAFVIQRRLVVFGGLLIVVVAAAMWGSGAAEALLERGASHRLEIWMDVLRRLQSDCSLLIGCGKDDYHFLGQFNHAHSGYVSMLYHAGAVGLGLFATIAFVFLKNGWHSASRWMLVALVGWGGVLTTTSGVFGSPRPLWIFFWIPTLMTVLESGRPALEAYYRAREAITRRV